MFEQNRFAYGCIYCVYAYFAGCSLSVVDIQDYITIEYSSQYNGYATPELIVDDNETNSMMDRKKNISYIKSLMSKDEEYKVFVDEFISLLEDDPEMFPAFTDFFDNEVLTDCGITLADFERGLALNFNGGSKTYFEIYWRD